MTVAAPEPPMAAKARGKYAPRLTMQGLLIGILIIALVMALVFQTRKLFESQKALSRYESSQVSTSLAPGQFRVIMNKVLDTSQAKVVTYRIETLNQHFATVKSADSSNGSQSRENKSSNLHWTEITLFIDHLGAEKRVKFMPKVGGGQGFIVTAVPEGYSLNNATIFHDDAQGVFSMDEIDN